MLKITAVTFCRAEIKICVMQLYGRGIMRDKYSRSLPDSRYETRGGLHNQISETVQYLEL